LLHPVPTVFGTNMKLSDNIHFTFSFVYLSLVYSLFSLNVYCIELSYTSFQGRSNTTLSTAIYSSEMKVKLLPALQDNYMFMIICEKSREAAIVDPVEPEKCLNAVKEENVKLTHILTTHHHW